VLPASACRDSRYYISGCADSKACGGDGINRSPSKVKNEFSVPDTLDTVIAVLVTDVAVADATRHSTVVPLVHDDVAQSMSASEPVGVRSVAAKLSPLSVAVSPPVAGMLLSDTRSQLTTGAVNTSKLSARVLPGNQDDLDNYNYRSAFGCVRIRTIGKVS
jgi:hypothetical protein